jgi:hypothetical protein
MRNIRNSIPSGRSIGLGLAIYFATSALVFGGVLCSANWTRATPIADSKLTFGFRELDLFASMSLWNGDRYITIAAHGYDFDPGKRSNVAFFPAYPAAISCFGRSLGVPFEVAALLVAHLFLAGAFVLLSAYLEIGPGDDCPRIQTLLAFGLFPAGFFLRMSQSEAMFVFLSILALYAIAKHWPLFLISIIIGAATATRPVGIALLVPLAIFLYREGDFRKKGKWVARASIALPVACSGLIAFMLYLQVLFESPIAFAQTQQHWRERPATGAARKVVGLATGEPLWSVYRRDSPCFWACSDDHALGPVFSIDFANPIVFTAAGALIAIGVRRRWLSAYEAALSIGLLAIPYLTRSFEMCMAGHARFAVVVFPIYLVLGRLIAAAPLAAQVAVFSTFGFFLVCYSCLMGLGFFLV